MKTHNSKSQRSSKKPSDIKIKSIQDTVRVNATERLSIVGFYGALFVGAFKILENIEPIKVITSDTQKIAFTRVFTGLFLVVIGFCVYQILYKYNHLIDWRREFLDKYKADIDPDSKPKNNPKWYDSKWFSIKLLLMAITAFLISSSAFIFLSGLLSFLAMNFNQNDLNTFTYIIPMSLSLVVFLIYLIISIVA